MSQATPKVSARKKIQAKQTTWNVTNRRQKKSSQVKFSSGFVPRRSRQRRSAQRPTPWISPQTTNVHPAPCQRPAEQHRQEQVAVRDRRARAATAERDVEVVAEPARERHVPAAPEVLQRRGCVRRVEVLRELEAEQERDADGDVGVAGEVGVDLHRVGVDGDQDLERRVLVGVGEDLVDDVRGQVARDHHLLEEPGGDQVEGSARVHPVRRAGRVQLRDELVRANDRPGDEVREEREVDGELLERRRLRVAAVDVDAGS